MITVFIKHKRILLRAVEGVGGMSGGPASYKEIVLAPAGPFADALAHIVDGMRGTMVIQPFGNPARMLTSRVGIIFGRFVTYGYVDLRPDGRRVTQIQYTRPGDDWRDADETGLVRKVHLNGPILRRLADFLGETATVPKGIQSVIPASK